LPLTEDARASPEFRILYTYTSAYVSRRQHTSAYVSIRQHKSAYVSICQHTSAYLSIPQHTSAYVSIRKGISQIPIRVHIVYAALSY
jgi:hypothetical protein